MSSRDVMEPSAAMREYLAEIYRLQEDSPTVSTTSLADRLDVSPPAVPRMLKRLQSAGYVKHVPYQGVELTERVGKRLYAKSVAIESWRFFSST
jgi:DtxR family transcriptional regulator, Mn-dependent transcriptional regulator